MAAQNIITQGSKTKGVRWGGRFKKEGTYLYLWLTQGEDNGTPLQYCCLENPMDGGAW